MGSSDTAGETPKIAAVLEAVAAALGTGDLSACLGAGRVPSVGWGAVGAQHPRPWTPCSWDGRTTLHKAAGRVPLVPGQRWPRGQAPQLVCRLCSISHTGGTGEHRCPQAKGVTLANEMDGS